MNNVLLSHKTDEWSTPRELYDFFMANGYKDPCPLGGNAAFSRLWTGKVFVNPPYSDIMSFVKYFIFSLHFDHKLKGWFLVPSRTDTEWFTQLFYMSDKIYFIKRRLRFGDSDDNAPFPSVLFHVYDRELGDKQVVEIVDRDHLLKRLMNEERKCINVSSYQENTGRDQ